MMWKMPHRNNAFLFAAEYILTYLAVIFILAFPLLVIYWIARFVFFAWGYFSAG
jgi:hypothetical protein